MNKSEARDELATATAMPLGSARNARVEELTRRIEREGPEDILAEALIDLIESYTFSDEGDKGFSALARALRLWDERPDLFDSYDQRNLFWTFKWVAGDLADWPQITKQQALAVLEDMRRRYSLAGHGSSGVVAAQFRYAFHTGAADAESIRAEWLATARDEFSQCAACEPGEQADYLYETGRYQELVALESRLHDSCNIEPARGLSAAAVAYLNLGDADAADRVLTEAMRATRPSHPREHASPRGQQLEALMRGGRLQQALKRLRTKDAILLEGADTPLNHLRFLLPVLAGLSATLVENGAMKTKIRTIDAPTVADLHRTVLAAANAHAEVFDRRNGNSYFAGLVAQSLAAVPAPAALPEPVDARRGTSPQSEQARSEPTTPDSEESLMTEHSNESSTDADTLAALTKARIQTILDGQEFQHGVDSDGDIVSGWDGNPFWFQALGDNGDVLRISAKWKAWLPGVERLAALEEVNTWNTSHFFPRASVNVDGDGDLVFSTDCSADLEFGITDNQLRNEVLVAISTSMNFFSALDERFPEALAAARAFHAQQGTD